MPPPLLPTLPRDTPSPPRGGGSTPTPQVNWRRRGEGGESRRPALPPRRAPAWRPGGVATAGGGVSPASRTAARWGGHDGRPWRPAAAAAVPRPPSVGASSTDAPAATPPAIDAATATTLPPSLWRAAATGTGSGTPPPTDEKEAVYEDDSVQLHVEHRLRASSSSLWSSPHPSPPLPPPGCRGGRAATAVASAVRPRWSSRGGGGGGEGAGAATASAGEAASEMGERGQERRGKGEGGGRPPRKRGPPSTRPPTIVGEEEVEGGGRGGHADTVVGQGG